ncbi:SpoIIE family protein phosphatase [Streptomyces sp. NPDC055189]
MAPELPPDLATAALLGGEMGRRFAAYDWGSHPLGPPSTWSDELRAAVAVGLTSRFPIVLWLGAEDLFLIYNDAYMTGPLGEKHPAAFAERGRDVWWDIWEPIAPMLAGVIETGVATWSDDLMLPIVTAGQAQERYFTFSYGPIITTAGAVDGVFCAVTETTERVLGQRRLNILNTVGSALMEARTVQGAARAAVAACAAHERDLPFFAVYGEGSGAHEGGFSQCTPRVAGLMPPSLQALLPPASAESPGSEMLLVTGLGRLLPSLASVFDAGLCPQQALALPVSDSAQGAPMGAVVIGLNPRQPLDDQYRGFCRLLADQMSAAFATASSYQRERERADLLAELDRAKTVFLTNVSHEFRTPLTLLLGPLDDALAQTPGESAQAARLHTARRNAQRLLRLVNSLLDFSRAEAGRAAPVRTLVDLGSLTAQIASSFTELCEQAGVELVLRCDDHVIADVDVGMWETVMLNLLSNAVKFTFAGAITVEVARDDEAVRVTVSDTGTGIAGADIGNLFDRFYRAGNTRGRSVEGSGIGLSLVRGLVELHEGSVDLVSEVDAGTTVTVRLPPVPEDERTIRGVTELPAPRPDSDNPFVAEALQWLGLDHELTENELTESPADPTADGPRGLVLIADDNADMRAHLRRIVSARWDTVVFADGAAALAGARQHHPDLIVTDVMMPALDGFELVTALRADPRLGSIPVLMLSARAGEEAAAEGFASGADDYLPKPFRSADLLDRIAARITAAERERAERERNKEQTQQATERAELSGRLSAATSIEDILHALLASPGSSLKAGAAAIALPDRELAQTRIHYAGGVPTELRDRYHTVAPDAPIPLTDVISSGEPMIVPDTAGAGARYRVVAHDAEGSVRAALIHPLKDPAGSVQGAVALLWPEPRPFGPAEVETFTGIVATLWTAVDRVRIAQREHRIATDFQEQLLDLDRRSPAAVVSALYEPAAESMRVGGDWYLVIPLDDPACVAVSVGDVVGHGLPAATVMSKLRSATTVSALSAADPRRVLGLLQKYASSVPGAACSTVGYAVIDARAHTISYACAGHPYPLVVPPTGAPRYLEHGRCAPLAASASHEVGPADVIDFPSGSLLIMYTDGLIERRGESLDAGFARLAAAAGQCRDLPVGSIGAELLRSLSPQGGYTDDVAVLALRPTGTTPRSFVTAVPAAFAHMADLRHRLRTWISELGMPETLQYDLLLAVGEAVGNAIEHGSASNAANSISVEAFADEEMVSTTVSDAGRWSGDSSASRREASRGRGLTLINGLSEHVRTVRSSTGTRVTMRHRRGAAPPGDPTSRGATP